MSPFGAAAKELRRAAHISQRELARRIPTDAGYLCKIEHGERTPSPELAIVIDAVLGAAGRLAALVPERPEVVAARCAEARAREAARAVALDDAYALGELSDDAYAAALRTAGLTRFPLGFTLGPCPSWCTTDHAAVAEFERTEGVRAHEVTVLRLSAGPADREVSVVVSAVDSFDERTRGPAGIGVSGGEYGLSSPDARRLAAAMLNAGDLADEWNTGRRR